MHTVCLRYKNRAFEVQIFALRFFQSFRFFKNLFFKIEEKNGIFEVFFEQNVEKCIVSKFLLSHHKHFSQAKKVNFEEYKNKLTIVDFISLKKKTTNV